MKNLLTLACCTLIYALSFCTLYAQDITGDWEGELAVQNIKLPLVFHIKKDGANYTATMDSPDQGVTGMPVEKATFENGELMLSIPAGGITYTAKPDAAFAKLEGTFTQMGNSTPLNMVRAGTRKKVDDVVKVKSENATKVAGDWNGVT